MTPQEKEIKEFAEKAIEKFNERITDEIFLFIQNDKKLMYEYLRIVEKHTLDTTNQVIGKVIPKLYHLDNKGRKNNPTSTLIKSYEEHTSKELKS